MALFSFFRFLKYKLSRVRIPARSQNKREPQKQTKERIVGLFDDIKAEVFVLDDCIKTNNPYIRRYKEYVFFLKKNREALLDEGKWDMILDKLPHISLPTEWTMGDYRPKDSTDNILHLYVQRKDIPAPSEELLMKYYFKYESIFSEGGAREDWEDLLPERIAPERIVTLDFTPEAIWDAYMLKSTDYYIGQRWHGNYHKMTIIGDMEELRKFFPWEEEEYIKYEKFINETEFDFDPKITLEGNVATIEHMAVFFTNHISHRKVTITYNKKERIIEDFKIEEDSLFHFTPRIRF